MFNELTLTKVHTGIQIMRQIGKPGFTRLTSLSTVLNATVDGDLRVGQVTGRVWRPDASRDGLGKYFTFLRDHS